MTRAFSLALLCTALLAPAATAQTATRDPGTGNYPDFVAWPSVEGTVPEAAYRLADAIQGGTGGWFAAPVVGPARDPAAPPLDALARSDVAATRGQLRSFLAELDARHGPEPGKHVVDAAHAVLGINARHLLDRLQATDTRRPR